MSVSLWNDKSAGNKIEADVAIIGGGIAGVSCLYWLSRLDPSLRVVLVEKGELAGGATGRNAGFVTCGSVEHFNRLVSKHGEKEALEIWRFSEENLELLKREIIKGDEAELLFEQKGSFSLAGSEPEMRELEKTADLMKKLGIEARVLGPRDVESRLGGEGFCGGIKYVKDASVHPRLLLEKILSKTVGNFRVMENCEVFSVEAAGDKRQVKTGKATVEAAAVVYATNGYSSLLSPFFKDKVLPTRGQILATEPLPRFMEGPCYANFVLDYFRQLPSGEMVIGGFRQLAKDVEKGYSDEISGVIQDALEDFLKRHIPAARGAKITHRWSGIMGFAADGQPYVGSMPSDPQSFYCAGFTGHGLGLAFNCAKRLAQAVLFGKEVPAFISGKR